jgi:hypothetical protein
MDNEDEFKKKIQERLEQVSEESKFKVSMGEQEHSIEFADGIAGDLERMASMTDEDHEISDKEYEERITKTVKDSIDKTGEIVIYSSGYNLDDYMDKEGILRPEIYWDAHKDGYNKTYKEFIRDDWEGLLEPYGLSCWDDVMILNEDGTEDTLITVLTDSYCHNEYFRELKTAVKEKDTKYEDELLRDGPFHQRCFNDIVIRPKKYNTLSIDDEVRAIRWLLRHRLGITEKYSIRYATFQEKTNGREAFISFLNDRIKSAGIEKDSDDYEYTEEYQREFFKKNNIEWYFGTYLAKDI